MLNVVRFLEKMGSEAQWNDLAVDKMELALTEAGIEGPVRAAILDKDVAQLQVVLQQKPPVCYIIPGEEPEEEDEEGEEEPGEKDARRLSSYSSVSQR